MPLFYPPATGGGSTSGGSEFHLKHHGTAGVLYEETAERWYIAGHQTASAQVTTGKGISARNYRMLPFIAGSGTVDQIAIWVTAAGTGSSLARVGIWDNRSDTSLYPGALVWDSGDQAMATAGRKVWTPAGGVALDAGKLYWAGVIANELIGFRVVTAVSCWPILGFATAETGAAGIGWQSGTAETTYPTALPNPMPATKLYPLDTGNDPPSIALRYAV